MDYFRKYLSGPGEGQSPTGADTVERLCDRVQSSTLLEDRRDAVRALKSLSRKFRLEVGTMALEILVNVLQMDRNDAEILGYALETLCNVMSAELLEEELDSEKEIPENLGIQFTEHYIKTTDNVATLLSLLEEYDFHVRWPTVKLITLLLANKTKDIQEIILTNPMGVSKMMDLLSDSREIIRNDGLLLLTQLTKGNTNIQKIVAFENAFERLLDIVVEEGSSDGGIVVEDGLLLLINLLKNNQSNQNFFKEGSFIQRLTPFFELQPADQNPQGGWSAQKVTNVHLMLQIVRTLVSPNNPQQQAMSCQKVMYTCEVDITRPEEQLFRKVTLNSEQLPIHSLLEKLSFILMASGVPADVLTETINTVSEVIRGNQSNQEYFASVMAPSTPPRPAIVVLLMSMVNEKQPFVLRCAVLYCFQSFLYKNELGQSQIIQTLLPSTAEVNAISAGQLLCGGLFSADSLSTWLAAVALLHSIVNNNAQKEQLLRVQLATSLGNPPVSLLQQCTNILAQGGKFQMRVGLLMLMCNWLASCPIAVTHFLHNANNVPFLISQISASEGDEQELVIQGLCAFLLGLCILSNTDQVEAFTKVALRGMIEKRIGLEMFTDKLSQVSKHESYSKGAKKPQLNYKQPAEVIFDYEFTQLLRKTEQELLKAVSPTSDEEQDTKSKSQSVQEHESIVLQYKELIREQDSQLNLLRSELAEMTGKFEGAQQFTEDMKQQVQMLKDQNSLLKANKGSFSGSGQGDMSEIPRLQAEIDERKKEIQEKNFEMEKLRENLTIAEAKVLVTTNEDGDTPGESAVLQATVNSLNKELEELKRKIEQKEEEVILYKRKYEETTKQVANLSDQVSNGTTEGANSLLLTERNNLSARVSELEALLGNMQLERQDQGTLEEKMKALEQDKEILNIKAATLEEEKKTLDKENKKLAEEVESQKKEHEDLLVYMSDQDNRLTEYKERLKKHGEVVSDEDDELDDGLSDDDLDDDDDDDQ